MIDKADLPVLGTFLIGGIGLTVIVLSVAALLGLAVHVFVWAYSGAW